MAAICFGSEDEMHISHDEGIAIVQLGPGTCITVIFILVFAIECVAVRVNQLHGNIVRYVDIYLSRTKIETPRCCEEGNW